MSSSTREPKRDASMLSMLSSTIKLLPRLVGDRVHLLVLELRRASSAAIWIAGLAFAALLMVVTVWFALWGGVVLALRDAGLSWPWVIAIVILLNLGGTAAAVMGASAKVKLLALPATMRRMKLAAAPATERAPVAMTARSGVVPAPVLGEKS